MPIWLWVLGGVAGGLVLLYFHGRSSSAPVTSASSATPSYSVVTPTGISSLPSTDVLLPQSGYFGGGGTPDSGSTSSSSTPSTPTSTGTPSATVPTSTATVTQIPPGTGAYDPIPVGARKGWTPPSWINLWTPPSTNNPPLNAYDPIAR